MFPVRLLFDKLSLNLRPSVSLGIWERMFDELSLCQLVSPSNLDP